MFKSLSEVVWNQLSNGLRSDQQVAFLMQSQVVRTGEAAFTVGTLERFDPRMFTEVTGQLVRSGELPRASLPHALIGLLSCVCAAMGLQVRALGVDFVTAVEITAVDSSLLHRIGRLDWHRVITPRMDDHRRVVIAIGLWHADDRRGHFLVVRVVGTLCFD